MEPLPILLVAGGEVYTPSPIGRADVLVVGRRILRVGGVDRRALDALGVEWQLVDASGGYVVPGLIDVHQHLLGGSGEGGFALMHPPITLMEIVRAGITTVVGVLGVDTTMQNPAALLGRVKALREQGMSAYMWTGGYDIPPRTLLGSVRQDMMFVEEVVGAGEIAIADRRGLGASPQQLSQLVRDASVGGLLSGKAGVTHFHVGEEPARLAVLRQLIDEHGVDPALLYPTHVQRNAALLDEAIALARRGATLDFDVAEQDLARWYRHYREHDGPPDRLTVSSDTDSATPDMLAAQLRGLVKHHGVPLEEMLRLVTTNPARILKLEGHGCLAAGACGDVVVLDRGDLTVREVIARGRRMIVGGTPAVRDRFLDGSARHVALHGARYTEIGEG